MFITMVIHKNIHEILQKILQKVSLETGSRFDPYTTISNEQTFLHDFLVILKRILSLLNKYLLSATNIMICLVYEISNHEILCYPLRQVYHGSLFTMVPFFTMVPYFLWFFLPLDPFYHVSLVSMYFFKKMEEQFLTKITAYLDRAIRVQSTVLRSNMSTTCSEQVSIVDWMWSYS